MKLLTGKDQERVKGKIISLIETNETDARGSVLSGLIELAQEFGMHDEDYDRIKKIITKSQKRRRDGGVYQKAY